MTSTGDANEVETLLSATCKWWSSKKTIVKGIYKLHSHLQCSADGGYGRHLFKVVRLGEREKTAKYMIIRESSMLFMCI